MKLPRRTFLHLAAGAAALPSVSRFALGQAYPTRPIRLVAPFPPGGSIDLTARLIGQWLTERLGQQLVVENHQLKVSLLPAYALRRPDCRPCAPRGHFDSPAPCRAVDSIVHRLGRLSSAGPQAWRPALHSGPE
jgi:hypothetical protein